MKAQSILIGALVTLLVGCSTTPPSSGPPASVFEKSKKTFGEDKAILAWVPSSGPIADETFTGLSSAAPSRMARGLAQTLGKAKTGHMSIAAAGPNSSKTRRVVIDALSLQEGALPGLRLLFIGDPSDRDAVRDAVEAHAGKFFFEPYE